MDKDINFYRECLRRELRKPFHKQDLMYTMHLDKIINQLKTKQNEKTIKRITS